MEHEITACAVLNIQQYNHILRVIDTKSITDINIYYQKCVYFNANNNKCVRVVCTHGDYICPVAFSEYSGPYEYVFDEKYTERYSKFVIPISVNENERIMFINCTVKTSNEHILHRSGMLLNV